MVAEATIAVCPDGSRISRLKRTRVERLSASVDSGLDVGLVAVALGAEGVGVEIELPFD